jgi:hypothetical protein
VQHHQQRQALAASRAPAACRGESAAPRPARSRRRPTSRSRRGRRRVDGLADDAPRGTLRRGRPRWPALRADDLRPRPRPSPSGRSREPDGTSSRRCATPVRVIEVIACCQTLPSVFRERRFIGAIDRCGARRTVRHGRVRPARGALVRRDGARRPSRWSTSARAVGRQRDRGLRWAALVRMPRPHQQYLRTARPRPGCCS